MKVLNFKKHVILFLFSIASLSFYGQNLPIIGHGDAPNYRISTYEVPGSSGLDLHWYGGIRFGDLTGNSVMKVTNGNVGIGVDNPLVKFEVSNTFNTNNNEVVASLKRFATGTGGSSIVRFGYHNTCDFEVNSGYSNSGHRLGGYFDLNIVNNHTGGQHGGINFATNSSVKMAIKANGNVGIGTTNPTSMLTVAGNIASREVKVTVDAGADFVFENDYNLPSLESVDKFIKENKHLPEIASAKEMQKDGINLSEMNIKLLQKIEELTLYIIEIKKENEKQNEKQNEEIKNLKNLISSKTK